MQYIPPYQQIVEHYREQVRTGQLHEGDQLPTTRVIAADWGVSRNTVAKALTTLQTQGLIVTAGRNGTRIAVDDRIQSALASPVVLAELPVLDAATARLLGVEPGISVLLLRVSPRDRHHVLQESPQPVQQQRG